MADSAVAQGNTGANQLPQSQIGSELANLLSDHLEEANTVGLADEQAAPSVPQKIREELKRRRQIQLQQKSNSNSPDPASFPRGYRSLK